MRYFYYGTELESKEGKDRARTCGNRENSHRRGQKDMMMDGELVVEEDTIYEIDRECEFCRQRRQNKW